jgi:hypothetical protein
LTPEDLVSPFLGQIIQFAEKISEANITIIKDAVVYHRDKEIEYHLQVILPNEGSRREGLAEKIQSIFTGPLIIEKAISYTAVIIPNSYDLSAKKIVNLEKGKFTLDVGKLMREGNFDIATLKIKVAVSDEILFALVQPVKSAIGILENARIRFRLELTLDYASAWYKKYNRFEIRDIEYYEHVTILPATIGEVLPAQFYARLMAASRAYQTGNPNAVKFFSILNNNFLLFEDEKYYSKILGTLTTEKDTFEIVEAIPKMQSHELISGGPTLILPGSMKFRIRTSIRGEEVAKQSKAFVDITKLKAIFAEMIALTNMQTKHMQF